MSEEIKTEPSAEPPTEKVEASENGDSSVFGVSIRAWLALLLVSTVCAMSLMGKEVIEPLYTLAGIALGYYMGQKKQK